MMPHPTSMAFAWEKDVQRCSRILVCVFLLAVIALIGASGLAGRTQDTTLVATGQRAQLVTTVGEPRFSDDREDRVTISASDPRFAFAR